MPLNSKKSSKNVIVAGLAVVFVMALWYQFVYAPAQKTISDSNSKLSDAVAAQKTSRAALKAPPAKTPPGELSVDQLNAAVPATPDVSVLLRQLEVLKVKDAMDWSTITPSAPTYAGQMMSMNVGISAGGSYDHVHQFVDDLLSMPRFAVVDTIAYTEGSVTGASSNAVSSADQGPPTGHLFGSPSGTPPMEVQLTVRVFNGAGTVAAVTGSAGTTGAQTATGAATSAASSASAGH